MTHESVFQQSRPTTFTYQLLVIVETLSSVIHTDIPLNLRVSSETFYTSVNHWATNINLVNDTYPCINNKSTTYRLLSNTMYPLICSRDAILHPRAPRLHSVAPLAPGAAVRVKRVKRVKLRGGRLGLGTAIWRFPESWMSWGFLGPKSWGTPNQPFPDGIFPTTNIYNPSIFGYPQFLETPKWGYPKMMIYSWYTSISGNPYLGLTYMFSCS